MSSLYEELMKFLSHEENFFIEAEAKPDCMSKFIERYNSTHRDQINLLSEGIICLEHNANKWGLELRLYVKSCPPESVRALGFSHNFAYRSEYHYRLNDNDAVRFLLHKGYKIGAN